MRNTVIAAVLGVLALAGCSTPNNSAQPSASASSEPRLVSKIPKPDTDQAEKLLYGLREINPELDRARSIDRARNVCSSLLSGITRAKIIEGARIRFEGGDVEISDADAQKIVKLVEDGGWCR
ncbi:hypothetical protein ACWEJ6_44560 [Nonomuraea sp. NPDC004702]